MAEFLLFICSLAIVVPALLIASLAYNANRTLQGKTPVSTEESITAVMRSLVDKVKQFFRGGPTKKVAKSEPDKPKADDAEFREVEHA